MLYVTVVYSRDITSTILFSSVELEYEPSESLLFFFWYMKYFNNCEVEILWYMLNDLCPE